MTSYSTVPVFTVFQGLLGGMKSLPDESNVRVLALFDNEEVCD